MYVCEVGGWLSVATKAFTSLGVQKSVPIKCVDLWVRVSTRTVFGRVSAISQCSGG